MKISPPTSSSMSASAVLDYHAFEKVRHVLAPIGRGFQEVECFLPLDDRDRVALVLEETGDRLLVNAVGFVLEAIDLDRIGDDTLALLESLERLPDFGD